MLTQIISHTPLWVWLLLVTLLWLGHSQSKRRTASLAKVATLPVVMVGLSLQGTISAFGAQPLVLGVWLTAGLATLAMVISQSLPGTTRFDPASQRFDLPGTWVPMLLILGIFFTKYTVGALSVLQPALAHGERFSLSFAALYGAFSGVFFGRAARLLRLSRTVRVA
jgi:hypothetical protein